MKLPPAMERVSSRFDRMSLRERGLVSAATLVGVLMVWTTTVFDPLAAKQRSLSAEMSTLQESIATTSQAIQSTVDGDPISKAKDRETLLQSRLDGLNEQLASKSGGLIAPERMVKVIHDVLNRQHGVTLISLHNKPLFSLVQPSALAPHLAERPPVDSATTSMPDTTSDGAPAPEAPAAESTAEPQPATSSGPYVHPVELVIEGSYLDVLAYLRALESLPWRFYWKVLELQTTHYPTNRVRIELSTLSMDKEWIGV